MVRLINKNNVKIISNFAYGILKIQEKMTYIKNVDFPEITNCIYVMWHANQFAVHGLPNKSKTNVLISTSLDGDIVDHVCSKWGFKTQRGSAGRKGAVASTLKMLECLKNNEDVVIMVDGPHGPYKEVKRGAVVLAKESGLPIVPLYWYSDEITFRNIPSWDKMIIPMGPCHILNLYGKPIYAKDKSEEDVAKEIKNSLLELEKIAPQKYQEAKRNKLWDQKA